MLVASLSDFDESSWSSNNSPEGRSRYRSDSYTMDVDSDHNPSTRPVTRRSAAAAQQTTTKSPGRNSKPTLDGAGNVESWCGIITTAKDALLLIEACRQGILPILMNRPKERERDLIRSGSIIVFMENQSGMKRWRDGFRWTPSRIATPFLIYRQLDDEHEESEPDSTPRRINDMKLKRGGLIKKALSLSVDETKIHMISYFTREDEVAGSLPTPSDSAMFSSIQIPDELWAQIQQDAVGTASTDSSRRGSEQLSSLGCLSSTAASSLSNIYAEQDDTMQDPSFVHHGIDRNSSIPSESLVPEMEEPRQEALEPFWVIQAVNANLMGNMDLSSFGASIMTSNGLVTPVQIPTCNSVTNAIPILAPFTTLNGLPAFQPRVIQGQPNHIYQNTPLLAYQPVLLATPPGHPQQYGLIPVAASQPTSMMTAHSSTFLGVDYKKNEGLKSLEREGESMSNNSSGRTDDEDDQRKSTAADELVMDEEETEKFVGKRGRDVEENVKEEVKAKAPKFDASSSTSPPKVDEEKSRGQDMDEFFSELFM